jgi:protein-disulfide isomerase
MNNARMISGMVCLFAGASCAFSNVTCSAFESTAQAKLAAYVQKKYKLPPATQLDVSEISFIGDTCYRKLEFKSQEGRRRFLVELVASPDFRFLAPELLDSRVDPIAEERQKRQELEANLTQGDFPSLGPKDAPVTIAIFSDFQCPFCAQMARDLKTRILPEQGDKVRVVFHNYPLAMHPWARTAAEAARCAQEQGDDYFWSLHDYLFEHQRELTQANLAQKIVEHTADLSHFEVDRFKACLANRDTRSKIDQDIAFGDKIGIGATPTVFVNGQKVVGPRPEQILTLIREVAAH